MSDRQSLIEILNEAAVLIQSGWMSKTWPGWVAYLLERLQVETDAKAYEEFLRNLKDAITARLRADRLRRNCQLVHLAIAAGACVGSDTIHNLRRDEALLAEYDEARAHHNFTCEEPDAEAWEAQLATWREEYGEHEEANDDRPE